MKNNRTYKGYEIEKSRGGIGSYSVRWYVVFDGTRKRFPTLKAAKAAIDKVIHLDA